VPTALQVGEASRENEFDELKPEMREVDEKLHRTVQEYFRNLSTYILWHIKIN